MKRIKKMVILILVFTLIKGFGLCYAVQYKPKATNRERINFNMGWKYYFGDPGWFSSPESSSYDDSSWEANYSCPIHINSRNNDNYGNFKWIEVSNREYNNRIDKLG